MTQLSQSNYLQYRNKIDWSRMPATLTDKPKTVADNAAEKGWTGLGEQTQKATEQFFKLCNMIIAKDPTILHLSSDAPTPASPEPLKVVRAKPDRKRKDLKQVVVKPIKHSRASDPKILTRLPAGIPRAKEVPVIATHTSFIKRYLAMHDKIKTRDQVVSLLHGLQKAVTEQRITKTNPAIREIQKMQSELIGLIQHMGDRVKIEIAEPYLRHYRQVAEGEEVRTSVKLLKQFIQINGKSPDKIKAEKLGKKLATAFDTIPAEDIYRDELAAAAKAISVYVNGNAKTVGISESALHGLCGLAGIIGNAGLGNSTTANKIIELLKEAQVKDLSDQSLKRVFARTATPGLCLELAKMMIRRGKLNIAIVRGEVSIPASNVRTTLSGMDLEENVLESGISNADLLSVQLNDLKQPSITGLGSISGHAQKGVPSLLPTSNFDNCSPVTEKVSAKDLAKLRFKTIGYNGRFKDVMGDPAIGFHMMVYGKPFQGKSSFVIELCKDLATLGKGRIAYLALEEGISASMQKKVVDRGADNVDGLDFLGSMPSSFNGYSFIVIDSVSDRSLKRDKLRELFLQNPETCFICIFHATKDGSSRGGLDYSHDMDIILKIESHKPYVEKNRFL